MAAPYHDYGREVDDQHLHRPSALFFSRRGRMELLRTRIWILFRYRRKLRRYQESTFLMLTIHWFVLRTSQRLAVHQDQCRSSCSASLDVSEAIGYVDAYLFHEDVVFVLHQYAAAEHDENGPRRSGWSRLAPPGGCDCASVEVSPCRV